MQTTVQSTAISAIGFHRGVAGDRTALGGREQPTHRTARQKAGPPGGASGWSAWRFRARRTSPCWRCKQFLQAIQTAERRRRLSSMTIRLAEAALMHHLAATPWRRQPASIGEVGSAHPGSAVAGGEARSPPEERHMPRPAAPPVTAISGMTSGGRNDIAEVATRSGHSRVRGTRSSRRRCPEPCEAAPPAPFP